MGKIKEFIIQNKLELITFSVIILIAAFLRFYRIGEFMTFLGDEGRDARVVRRLLLDFDIILIGPMTSVVTSAGHMYLGPLYYYLMAPALLVSGLSPVGPAAMVALFSLATIVLLWWVGRSWWSPSAGLVAAALYAVSPTVIIYSRSSWNPNVMPFFALLSMWSIYQVFVNRKYKWLLVTGASLAFVLQSHYLGLLIVPTLVIFWVLTLIDLNNRLQFKGSNLLAKFKKLLSIFEVSINRRIFWQYTIWGLLIFFFLMSPLVVFDARHGWMNSNALLAFFTERQTTVNFKFYKGFENLWPITEMVFSSMLTVGNKLISKVVLWILGLSLVLNFWQNGWKKFSKSLYILLVWLVVGILGLSIYKQNIFDHYFGFLYPVPFLLLGWIYFQVMSSNGLMKYIEKKSKLKMSKESFYLGPVLIGAILIYNLYYSPFFFEPNRQLQKTMEVGKKIIEESDGEAFNLALIARSNYDEAYRYILEWKQADIVEIQPAIANQTIANQLFVICENHPPFEKREDDCDPIAHPKSEIALFGWAEIEDQWEFDWGTKLYKLIHLQEPINN